MLENFIEFNPVGVPYITISKTGIWANSVIHNYFNTDYIKVLINEKENQIAFKESDHLDKNSIKIDTYRSNSRISCSSLLKKIKVMSNNDFSDNRYRIYGEIVNDQKLIIFQLDSVTKSN